MGRSWNFIIYQRNWGMFQLSQIVIMYLKIGKYTMYEKACYEGHGKTCYFGGEKLWEPHSKLS